MSGWLALWIMIWDTSIWNHFVPCLRTARKSVRPKSRVTSRLWFYVVGYDLLLTGNLRWRDSSTEDLASSFLQKLICDLDGLSRFPPFL